MNQLEAMGASGLVRPGDILLFQNGERGFLNWAIRYAQRAALRNLDPALERWRIRTAAQYTHAAQVAQVREQGSVVYAEQYAPHARYRTAGQLPVGMVIMIRRPRGATMQRMAVVMQHWAGVIKHENRYPIFELLYYWFRWVRKTHLAQHFSAVFRSRRANVCSGEVVCACQFGGWFGDESPDAWYPARLALDRFWTEHVATIVLTPPVDPCVPQPLMPVHAH